MRYEFSRGNKNGKDFILGYYYNEDNNSEINFEVGTFEELIGFINENISGCVDVYFDDFSLNDIDKIIESISDEIDVFPNCDKYHYQFFGKIKKHRGK